MCGFLRGKPHAARWPHKAPQEIRVRSIPISKLLQRLQTRNPARDASAEFVVFLSEFSMQRRFFVKNNKSEKSRPNDHSVFQQADVAEEQSLAEDQQRHSNIHRVAHVAIESGNHKPLRGGDGCGRSQPLDCEASKGIQQNGKANCNHQRPDDAANEKVEQRRG